MTQQQQDQEHEGRTTNGQKQEPEPSRDATVWLVGRLATPWEVQGAYTTEAAAVARCEDSAWFVMPLTLNAHVPNATVLNDGAYYPKTDEYFGTSQVCAKCGRDFQAHVAERASLTIPSREWCSPRWKDEPL